MASHLKAQWRPPPTRGRWGRGRRFRSSSRALFARRARHDPQQARTATNRHYEQTRAGRPAMVCGGPLSELPHRRNVAGEAAVFTRPAKSVSSWLRP